MANFTQNITNTVRCFGNGPSTKWGQNNGLTYTMTWGTTKWGEDVAVLTTKVTYLLVSNSIDATFDYYRSDVRKLISNSITPTSENASERLYDGTGRWTYVFPSGDTNAEERDIASWSESSGSAVSFTCQAASSVSWG